MTADDIVRLVSVKIAERDARIAALSQRNRELREALVYYAPRTNDGVHCWCPEQAHLAGIHTPTCERNRELMRNA